MESSGGDPGRATDGEGPSRLVQDGWSVIGEQVEEGVGGCWVRREIDTWHGTRGHGIRR